MTLWRGGLPPFSCEAVVIQPLRCVAENMRDAARPNGGKPPRHIILGVLGVLGVLEALEIPLKLLYHRQRHHRRGLGAQYSRTKARGVETSALGLIDLGIGQATLGSDQKSQRDSVARGLAPVQLRSSCHPAPAMCG
ncbi:hypothetical protein PS645_05073 [Pseudomonas fluorescens]|uniref:Uncharacterized protein n=1 Tax=Pseudomonas fluorescens TaxID=294 RepID=A0A5E6X458_PSEFL|nr:hypothetical protein PS645_05073 [Pseudomonas fluorescens]